MERREFLAGVAGAAATRRVSGKVGAPRSRAEQPHRPPEFELEEITLGELQAGMEGGRWTSRSVTEQYLSRIEAFDRNGPALRAVIELNPEALSLAEELDAERRAKGPRGPLHGVPILVKDNLDSGDRMLTTAGSLALSGARARQDATVVARLRAAGAVLLGKTNLSEWANYRSTNSSSGWSGRGGLTRNPYVLDRNPCGSSSGSATAAAANLAALTIGTETDGSIVCPASICGLVGIKPTVGLVSRTGIIPISATQDTAGPMCRTVADAAALLAAIQAVDPTDPATRTASRPVVRDWTAELKPDGLRGARLGIARAGFGLPGSVEPVLQEAIAVLKHEGALVFDPAEIPHVDKLGDPETVLLDYEFKAGLAAYFTERRPESGIQGLAQLIEFNRANREREMPWFGQEIFERAVRRGALTDPVYLTARRSCRRLARTLGLDAVLRRLRLDAIVAITAGPAWPTDLVNGDRYTGGSSSPAAVAGYPHLTVPAGNLHGLPIGLSFMGPAWSEGTLIRFGYAFERATRQRRRPQFLPSL